MTETKDYHLQDVNLIPEDPRGEMIHVYDFTNPSQLSERDWLEVARFIDEVIMVPGGGEKYRTLDPRNPNILALMTTFWSSTYRSIVHVALSTRGRILGTGVTTMHSLDTYEGDHYEAYKKIAPDGFVSISRIGTHPDCRGRGIFKQLLRPGIEGVINEIADDRGEAKVLINLAPGDRENRWDHEGFEPIPEKVQRELDAPELIHLIKTVRGNKSDSTA